MSAKFEVLLWSFGGFSAIRRFGVIIHHFEFKLTILLANLPAFSSSLFPQTLPLKVRLNSIQLQALW